MRIDAQGQVSAQVPAIQLQALLLGDRTEGEAFTVSVSCITRWRAAVSGALNIMWSIESYGVHTCISADGGLESATRFGSGYTAAEHWAFEEESPVGQPPTLPHNRL